MRFGCAYPDGPVNLIFNIIFFAISGNRYGASGYVSQSYCECGC